MSETVLQHSSSSADLQAHAGQYFGVETALDFGDPARELNVLLGSCGVFALTWRAKGMVAGKDRARWLHNMVTNNVRDLPVNRGCYNFVLNAQGRILGDMYIYNRGEYLAFDTDRQQIANLLPIMKRFIIMDKVEMNAAEETEAIGICGRKAEEVLAAMDIGAGSLAPLEIREQKLGDAALSVVRGPENKPGWYELWGSHADLKIAHEALVRAGATPVGAQALEWWRILHGVPHYGVDIRDRDLPQETGQTQALNFNKGCYIGQEIVERIRSRGQVHRHFTGFEFSGQPAAIKKYDSAGRTVAEVTSAARIPLPAGVQSFGLGYVREEARTAGPELDLEGCKARIADLPFAI